jgi:hypothetical protein
MKRHLLITAAAALLFAPSAFATEDDSAATAGDAGKEAVQVEPGSAPTDAMTEETPKMTEDLDHDKHPPTAEIGDEVPPMTPDDEKQAADDDAADDSQDASQ